MRTHSGNPFILWALAAGLAGAAACSRGQAAPGAGDPAPAPAVVVTRAASGVVESAIEVSGSLAPETRVAVHAKLAGTLDAVLVRLGDRVRQGDVLARLDRREIDAQVDAAAAAVNVARASLDAAEAGLANARQDAERARNLYDRGAMAKQRADAAATALRVSEAQRDLARANVAQAEAAHRRALEVQRDATLRAPVSGVVVERNVDPGNLVGPGNSKPVVALADLRVLTLEAGVSELDAGRLRAGARAAVTLPARPGETFTGVVSAIAPEVDPRNRHFRIEIRVDNGAAGLLGGMYATARIVVDRSDGVVVPMAAVFTHDGRPAVYRVSGDTVTAVPVTTGLSDGSRIAVVSGLAVGDVLVADARRDITDGARVRPVTEG